MSPLLSTDVLAHALSEFTKRACKLDIGAMQETKKTIRIAGKPLHVQHVDAQKAKEWRETSGRQLALKRAFDK